MRIIRDQTFCWQEKFILRLLRSLYQGQELVKMKCLYSTLTEMDSDFNGREIKWYTKTISTYSGLSKEWIPSGLKKLEELGIIQIVEEKEHGRFKGKYIIFTPQKAKNTVKTVTGKPFNGESLNGYSDTSEHISLLEHNSYLEHIYENSSQADDINHNTDIVVESTSEEQLENEFSSIYIPEKTNKKKYKQAVSSKIIETWNNQSSLPNHSQAKLDKEIKKKHIDQMSFHSEDNIVSAIESYAKILESGDYYFNFRWSFWDFIIRGLDKFVPDMKPYENFRRKSFNEEPTKEEKEAKYRERLEYNRKLFEKLDKERKNEQR